MTEVRGNKFNPYSTVSKYFFCCKDANFNIAILVVGFFEERTFLVFVKVR